MPGSDAREISESIERLEDRGRGDEEDKLLQEDGDVGRAEDMVERKDCCEDLDGGMSMPSNFTLCLNYKNRTKWTWTKLFAQIEEYYFCTHWKLSQCGPHLLSFSDSHPQF